MNIDSANLQIFSLASGKMQNMMMSIHVCPFVVCPQQHLC